MVTTMWISAVAANLPSYSRLHWSDRCPRHAPAHVIQHSPYSDTEETLKGGKKKKCRSKVITIKIAYTVLIVSY